MYRQVKENVWKVEKENRFYSLKKYDHYATTLKVKWIHKQLQQLDYPFLVPVLSHEDPLVILQPWIHGAKAINFKKRADRIDSLLALTTLHDTSSRVNWQAAPYLHRYPLLDKWQERLERFKNKQQRFSQKMGQQRVEQMIDYAERSLPIIRHYNPMQFSDTLLHGDVVHHNILRDETGWIRLIDFDLACIGPAGIELALWIHRVLPQIGYQIHYLWMEHPQLARLDNAFQAMLLFPNELLREWLHWDTLSKEKQERLLPQLLPFTDVALSSWSKLWYDIKRNMK